MIRHTVLPALERFNPSASATLAADAARFAADNDFLEQQSDQLCRNCLTIEPGKAVLAAVSLFAAHPALQARAVLRAVAAVTGSTRDISQKHIDAILALSRTGAQFQASNIFVRRTHAALVFTCQKPDTVTYCYPLEPGRPLYIPEIDRTVCCTRCDGIDDPTALYLDADKLSGMPLSVRCRQNGDRFRPAGGQGEKKLKEYLIDKKIPVDQRCRIPLLIADGQIAAVLGMQTAQPFAPNTKTTCFYKLTITGGTTDATSRL